jgi:hypothetical protein
MSRTRREALLDAAAAHGIPVIEDSPYRKVRFEGNQEPSLKALDRHEGVYLLGTFSKLIAPGLRIGWVAAPRNIIARLVQLKSDGGSCPLTQRIILEFAKREFSVIEKVQTVYRVHRDRMVAALKRSCPVCRRSARKLLRLARPRRRGRRPSVQRADVLGAIFSSKFFAGLKTGSAKNAAHRRTTPDSPIPMPLRMRSTKA